MCFIKPNPYNPEEGPLVFFGSGIVQDKTKICIYSLSGKLLWENEGKYFSWDGKTFDGNIIMPGIYIYTYESFNESGINKFTVIRKK